MNATVACKNSYEAFAVLCLIKIVTTSVNFYISHCVDIITLSLLAIF